MNILNLEENKIFYLVGHDALCFVCYDSRTRL